ncbi:DUF4215 domain-containing protein [Nannocystis sp.]|uniref:DUF4215 domain-containing protein n=1 Tax=Nannocystis sp. TaxID=1962667 RepID=UPI0026013D0F|nr:DUF4215 domain-containing protein [Nannocystis sp.]MBK7827513.1 hypothetical protein [Nannocystis sp.]
MGAAVISRVWLLGACMLAACFADHGPPGQLSGSSGGSSEGSSASTTQEEVTGSQSTGDASGDATSEVITTGPPPNCGDGVVDADEACDDGNRDDADACRNSCQPASCGDGVVWVGSEECDAGAGNSPTLPGACRPTCKLPACGDGSLYIGPLGDPVDLLSPIGQVVQGNDAPRPIGVADSEVFAVVWRIEGAPDKLLVQQVDGGNAVDLNAPAADVTDSVIGVAPGGDVAVVWEAGPDIRMRGIKGGVSTTSFLVHAVVPGTKESPSVALGGGGQAIVAFLAPSANLGNDVYVRMFADFAVNQGAPEQRISMHPTGVATPPTVALHPSGRFVVAWGDPSRAIIYRRFAADGTPAALVTTEMRVDSLSISGPRAWAGVALSASDEAVVIVGHDAGDHLAIERRDVSDALAGTVQVTADDARFAPFVDVASDASGNLAVAWTACGSPQDVGALNCDGLPARAAIRWFYADLVPVGPEAPLLGGTGMPPPVGVAVAPSGVTGVSYIAGNKVLVRVTPLVCP